jgi:RNA recognition motif-containing protein
MGWCNGWSGGAIVPQRHHNPTNREDRSMTIFVGNIYWETTEADVEQLFASYGTVRRVQILRDRATGRSRGFGFVEMPDATEAQAAIAELNGTSQWGRTLTVTEARSREERRPRDHGEGRQRSRW